MEIQPKGKVEGQKTVGGIQERKEVGLDYSEFDTQSPFLQQESGCGTCPLFPLCVILSEVRDPLILQSAPLSKLGMRDNSKHGVLEF